MTQVYKPHVGTRKTIKLEETSPFWQRLAPMLAALEKRLGKELTYKEIADAVSLTETGVRKWIRGASVPGYPTRVKLAQFLGRPKEDLMFDMEDSVSPRAEAERPGRTEAAAAINELIETYLTADRYGIDTSPETAEAIRSIGLSRFAKRPLEVRDIHRLREVIDSFRVRPEGGLPPNGTIKKKPPVQRRSR